MKELIYLEYIDGTIYKAEDLPCFILLDMVEGTLMFADEKPYFIYHDGNALNIQCVDYCFDSHFTRDDTNTGIRLRTLIDVAFSDHVKDYKTRNDIITKIFESLEEQELGDWLTEDTGRTYKLTFIPTDKN